MTDDLFDTHSHELERSRNGDSRGGDVVDGARRPFSLVVSCKPADWDCLIEMHQRSRVHTIAFGLHPWWLGNEVDDDAPMQRLKDLLDTYDTAVVGEIGLDRIRRNIASFEVQKRYFQQQWSLAVELNRCVSLHCVKAFGHLFDVFEHTDSIASLPAAVSFHSFCGREGVAAQLARRAPAAYRRRIFFGFSYVINCSNEKLIERTRIILKEIVADEVLLGRSQLLLESDVEEGGAAVLRPMVDFIASALDEKVEEIAILLNENAQRFLSYNNNYNDENNDDDAS